MKGLIWTLVTTFFGLLQLEILAGSEFLSAVNKFDFGTIIIECGLVFFSTALVSSVAIDGFMGPKLFDENWKIGAYLAFVPFIVIVVSVIVYLSIKNRASKPVDMETIKTVQLAVTSFSVIYAIGIKKLQFSRQEGT